MILKKEMQSKCDFALNLPTLYLFFKFIYFEKKERERAWAWGGEGQRERERENPKQAPGCQHRAHGGVQSHKPWDCDLNGNQELNT